MSAYSNPPLPPATAEHQVLRPRGANTRERLQAALPMLRPAGLVVVVAVSAVLNLHRLSTGGYANIFYSAGVKSMLHSWHNFVFVAFDPGGLVSVDKPPLGLWVQVLSAKAFGFSPLSLLAPEAIAGVLAVAALYLLLVRRLGLAAAFAGALALAVFPSFVAVSRDNGVDPLMILLMVLACWTGVRAAETGRWLSLIASAVLVGLAFNTKTLAAVLVVPGIACAFLVCAPGSLRARAVKLLVAGVVMAAVSFSWIAFVEATPASKRPYVGSSTNNTELGLTFEYNGFGRVEGQIGGPGQVLTKPGARVTAAHHRPASARRTAPAAPAAVAQSSTFLPNGRYRNPIPFGSRPSPVRLFGKGLGDQAGWMIPFALFGLMALALLALLLRRSRLPEDPAEAQTSEFASVAPAASVEPEARPRSPAAIPVEPALAGAAPPAAAARPGRRDPELAALLVMGGWFLAEMIVLSGSKGIVHPYYVSALAPATGAMVGGGAVALARLRRGSWPLWGALLAAFAVIGTIVVQVLLLYREHYMLWLVPALIAGGAIGLIAFSASRRLAAPALALTLALLLVAPTAYSATTWLAPVEGTFPAAGPKATAGGGGFGIGPKSLEIDKLLLAYVRSHHPGRRWALFTVASDAAAPFILLGLNAGSLGGYSGTDPTMDGAGLARLVARGDARYVVLGGLFSTRGGNRATDAVLRSCKQLPSTQWHSPTPYTGSLVLFDCAGRERALRGS